MLETLKLLSQIKHEIKLTTYSFEKMQFCNYINQAVSYCTIFFDEHNTLIESKITF